MDRIHSIARDVVRRHMASGAAWDFFQHVSPGFLYRDQLLRALGELVTSDKLICTSAGVFRLPRPGELGARTN